MHNFMFSCILYYSDLASFFSAFHNPKNRVQVAGQKN